MHGLGLLELCIDVQIESGCLENARTGLCSKELSILIGNTEVIAKWKSGAQKNDENIHLFAATPEK